MVRVRMCESQKCGFNPTATLSECDKERYREIRRQVVNIIEMFDSLVLADANPETIDTFIIRQLESIARIVKK